MSERFSLEDIERLQELIAAMKSSDTAPEPPPPQLVIPTVSPLPLHIRTWLSARTDDELKGLLWWAKKSDEDRSDMDLMLKDYRSAKILGRFGAWLIPITVAFFGTSFAVVKFGFDAFGWIRGVGK